MESVNEAQKPSHVLSIDATALPEVKVLSMLSNDYQDYGLSRLVSPTAPPARGVAKTTLKQRGYSTVIAFLVFQPCDFGGRAAISLAV